MTPPAPPPTLIWGAPQWRDGALILLGVAALALLWSYGRARARGPVRLAAATLKAVGFAALALCLLEPMLAGTRPRRGANAFAVLADNSQSLRIRDPGGGGSRADWVRGKLAEGTPWRTRLGQDFDVRTYAFDSRIRALDGEFAELSFDGSGSALGGSLEALARRYRGLPLAGVLVFTDGNRTDSAEPDWEGLPPIYPVAPPTRGRARDVGIGRVVLSQTNFEAAPAVVRAEVSAAGFAGEPLVAVLSDESGEEVAREKAKGPADGEPWPVRFQFRPVRKGVSFYKIEAFAASDEAGRAGEAPPASGEQTLANNARLVAVDQGGGPYRVLYVGGRPNWEFKFLRRALADDDQVELVGLVRLADRQPKFDFRDPRDRSTSRLYEGFDNPDAETAERADQPVLVRLGTRDEAELRDGFPKTADELFAYHAVILDDLEAKFFTPDQQALLRSFVAQRGGGLMMLGGPNSFVDGRYDRTPVGELLPVYLDRRAEAEAASAPIAPGDYRLALTREGWLQPWVRLRNTEDEDRKRLAGMPGFGSLNRVGNLKPGAVVLAEARGPGGEAAPALVAQSFGKGRAAALLVGDLWRWGMKRDDPAESDLERAWRQAVRWLVADVPGRVEVEVRPRDGDAAAPAVVVTVRVRDAEYRPLDNAEVSLSIAPPGGGPALTLEAEPDDREAGTYSATYVARKPGPYRVTATATAPDGSPVDDREAGWAAQPDAEEFARLEPDRGFLAALAARTGGAVVDGDDLDSFVAGLASRPAPITEPWTAPVWHHPLYFLVAIACLAGEWGLRRMNGLP